MMDSMKRVAVLMGGMSKEREVSLETGNAIAGALRELGHEAVQVDVAADLPRQLEDARPDAAFLALHGRLGEDGTVQGLLEIMRIPYTGSGVLACAVTMDKVTTKKILRCHGIPLVEDVVVRRGEPLAEAVAGIESELPLPVMVKPAGEGSSIGVSEVRDAAGLEKALVEVFAVDEVALVERFIDGRLLTVGLLGEGPVVLPVLEIRTSDGFYDYEAKYEPGRSEYEVPAKLTGLETRSAQEMSLAAFTHLGCEGISRIDLMLEKGTGELYVLEVNTIPGMTANSLIPKAAGATGMTFNEVVETVLSTARLKIQLGE